MLTEGPGADAVVYDYGKSAGRTAQQAGLLFFVLLYVLFVALSSESRWTAAFTQWWPLMAVPALVAVYGSLRVVGVLRRNYWLALDAHGVWFRDGKTYFHVPFDMIRSVAGKSSEASQEASGIVLTLKGENAVAASPGLSEARGRVRVSRGTVTLPVSGNLSRLGRDFDRLAPQLMTGKHWGVYRRGRR
jgi:hypothetical protein